MRTIRNSLFSAALLIAAALGFLGQRLAADDEIDLEEQAAHRARIQKVASSIHLYPSAERGKSELKLKSEPVLRYTDATRKQHEAGLWVWGTGRPAAIMAIEYYPNNPNGKNWLFEIASLSPDRIAVERGGNLYWTAKEPGLKLRDLPGAPTAADKPAGRLTQVKQLQRRFAASEKTPTEGRIELRALPTPIHRYRDESADVIDGVIMSFANGTNPEVLLILEAHGKSDGPATWNYSLAQMTGGEVAVEFDGKPVWLVGEADPPAMRDSYVNGWISLEK